MVHVLLVEDDPLVREVVAEGLAEAGLAVSTAGSAEDVLTLNEGVAAPDVLVTDINLPGSDGFSLAGVVRKRWPGLRVVFISGRPMNIDGNVLQSPDAFLVKPFTSQDLVTTITALLNRTVAMETAAIKVP